MKLAELIDEAKNELRAWFEDHPEADEDEAQRAIDEIADCAVPTSSDDIFQCATDSPRVRTHVFEDYIILGEDADLTHIVQVAIFEEILDELNEDVRTTFDGSGVSDTATVEPA